MGSMIVSPMMELIFSFAVRDLGLHTVLFFKKRIMTDIVRRDAWSNPRRLDPFSNKMKRFFSLLPKRGRPGVKKAFKTGIRKLTGQ